MPLPTGDGETPSPDYTPIYAFGALTQRLQPLDPWHLRRLLPRAPYFSWIILPLSLSTEEAGKMAPRLLSYFLSTSTSTTTDTLVYYNIYNVI